MREEFLMFFFTTERLRFRLSIFASKFERTKITSAMIFSSISYSEKNENPTVVFDNSAKLPAGVMLLSQKPTRYIF